MSGAFFLLYFIFRSSFTSSFFSPNFFFYNKISLPPQILWNRATSKKFFCSHFVHMHFLSIATLTTEIYTHGSCVRHKFNMMNNMICFQFAHAGNGYSGTGSTSTKIKLFFLLSLRYVMIAWKSSRLDRWLVGPIRSLLFRQIGVRFENKYHGTLNVDCIGLVQLGDWWLHSNKSIQSAQRTAAHEEEQGFLEGSRRRTIASKIHQSSRTVTNF